MAAIDSLTLALTAYNEEEALASTASRAIAFLQEKAASWQLIIVDDGSTDKTSEIAKQIEANNDGVVVVVHDQNGGMGRAIKSAIQHANQRWFCVIAADGQVDPKDLAEFCKPAMDGAAVFSTYRNRDDGLDRWVLSSGLRVIFLVLMGIWRVPTGNYFVPTGLAKSFELLSDSFVANFEVYFNVRRQKGPVKWVSLPCARRQTGVSKVRSLKNIWRVFVELLRFRLRG